jgi:hypothetical protein
MRSLRPFSRSSVWFVGIPAISRRESSAMPVNQPAPGNSALHISRSFLVERRHPFAALLLPHRSGDNLPRLLLAAAGCILGRRIGHDDRIFIEPEIRKIGQRKAVDRAIRARQTVQGLLLPSGHYSVRDIDNVVRDRRFDWLCVVVLPGLPARLFLALQGLLYACIRLRVQLDA